MVDIVRIYTQNSAAPAYYSGSYATHPADSENSSGEDSILGQDSVTLSPEARSKAERANAQKPGNSEEKDKSSLKAEKIEDRKANGEALTEEEKQEVGKLRERDTEVRAHEQAHLSAAGSLAAGGAKYTFKTGPDSHQYAVGGEVPLKIPDAPAPEEDLRNARQLERAALAPAKPSASDRAIAAEAREKAAKAQQEIIENQTRKLERPEELVDKNKIKTSQLTEQLGLSKSGETEENGDLGQDFPGGQISFDKGDTGHLDVMA